MSRLDSASATPPGAAATAGGASDWPAIPRRRKIANAAFWAACAASEGGDSLSAPPAVLAALALIAVPGTDGGMPPTGITGAEEEAAGTAEDAVADTGPADTGEQDATWLPRALFIELQPPPPAVARSLRLSVGQSAATVTVRFDDPARGRPAALTVAVLRADMFRIVVESPASQSDGTAGSFPGAWTYAVQDWEP